MLWKLSLSFLSLLAFTAKMQAESYSCTSFPLVGNIAALNNSGKWAGTSANRGYVQDELGNVTFFSYPGAKSTSVAGINNAGDIDGAYVDAHGAPHLYIRLANGTFLTVPTLSDVGWDHVGGINDNRDIAVSRHDSSTFWIFDSAGNLLLTKSVSLSRPEIGSLNNDLSALFADDSSVKYPKNAIVAPTGVTLVDFPYPPVVTEGGYDQIATHVSGLNNHGSIAGWWHGLTQFGQSRDYSFVHTAHTNAYSAATCTGYQNSAFLPYALNDQDWVAGVLSSGESTFAVLAKPNPNRQPLLLISNDSWTFAPTLPGTEGGHTGTVYVSNGGPAPLHILNVGQYPIVGQFYLDPLDSDLEPFVVTNTTCASSVNPGNSCFISFAFNPSQLLRTGDAANSIILADDSPDGPHFISLHARVLGTTLRLSNATWTFHPHPVGEASGPGTVYVSAAGGLPVSFSSVGIFGPNAADFAITANTCQGTLPAYQWCKVEFFFKPTGTGMRVANLGFRSNAEGSPQHVVLSGAGN